MATKSKNVKQNLYIIYKKTNFYGVFKTVT